MVGLARLQTRLNPVTGQESRIPGNGGMIPPFPFLVP
jgi:hypothetical protein